MYRRAEYQIITERMKEPRKFIQVVMGARQIGKSTVVKQVLQDLDMPYQFFLADNVPATNSAWISDCWAAVRSLKESRGWESVILVIDEIQKIANWSEVVKKEWDVALIRSMTATSRSCFWGAVVCYWKKAYPNPLPDGLRRYA